MLPDHHHRSRIELAVLSKAEQIMRGTKKIEYRSMPTHIRERVYIRGVNGTTGVAEVEAYGLN